MIGKAEMEWAYGHQERPCCSVANCFHGAEYAMDILLNPENLCREHFIARLVANPALVVEAIADIITRERS